MHGLINRAIEMFVRDIYGRKTWIELVKRTDLEAPEFEPMLEYPDSVTDLVLDDIAQVLAKSREDVLEDIGTYLVSHPSAEAVRRLLRFSGADFADFLQSLDDLPARTRLALPDLNLPRLELNEHAPHLFTVTVSGVNDNTFGYGHVLVGLLRALADDYGALVLLDHKGVQDGKEEIEIQLLEAAFAEGRSFTLSEATT